MESPNTTGMSLQRIENQIAEISNRKAIRELEQFETGIWPDLLPLTPDSLISLGEQVYSLQEIISAIKAAIIIRKRSDIEQEIVNLLLKTLDTESATPQSARSQAQQLLAKAKAQTKTEARVQEPTPAPAPTDKPEADAFSLSESSDQLQESLNGTFSFDPNMMIPQNAELASFMM